MQRKIETLQYELDLFQKLIVYIRTGSNGEADEIVRQIRAGGDPLEIAKSFPTEYHSL